MLAKTALSAVCTLKVETKEKMMSYITDEVGGPLRAFDLQSPCGDPRCTTQVVQVRAIHVL